MSEPARATVPQKQPRGGRRGEDGTDCCFPQLSQPDILRVARGTIQKNGGEQWQRLTSCSWEGICNSFSAERIV
jgi:hypothetical protein